MNDIINGLFELTGALLVWTNVRQIRKDKKVRGVYWPAQAMFAAWSIWNLYYYPSLAQWWSFTGALSMAVGNVTWTLLALKYRKG